MSTLPGASAAAPSPAKTALAWLHTARFLTTAPRLEHLPTMEVPEIAFVGRSNAGKSTCINTLTQQKRLAFASKTPGRTQAINLFALGKQGETDAVLADLPGYGYAAVPKADKIRWQQVMANYLVTRENLRGVVMLCDPRHGLTELDDILLEVIRPRLEEGLQLLVLLTKADKLNRAEAQKALSIARLQTAGGTVKLFSALKRQGVDETALQLWQWTHPESGMIQTYLQDLPHGITLSCRAAGERGRPVLVFLHGFPEAAFIWDETIAHFAQPENGGYRCVAPNLRGFEHSSQPTDVAAYRAKHLVQDLVALIAIEGGPLACLVAHDWGGAVAWNLANQRPDLTRKLAIINSPHPGTFLRELKSNPRQQEASAYMNFLIRPDAERILREGDYRRLFGFFTNGGGGGWLTDAVKQQYREVWDASLTGGCNYYRASPLRPPARRGDPGAAAIELPHAMLTVDIPTFVLWAMEDIALPPELIDGLDGYIRDLTLERVPGANHWIIHERPAFVAERLGAFLARQ